MARVIDTRRSRLLLATLVFAHLLAISHQVDGGGGISLLERSVFLVLSPFQRLVAAVVRSASHAWADYVDLRGVREENRRLEGRVRTLETDLQQERHQAGEAARLRELLSLQAILPLETVAAEVVSREGQPWFRIVTLNRGTADGVALNAAVISPSGVVGRVIRVGPKAAQVQLLLDTNSGVGVLLERTRTSGVVSGQVGPDSGQPELVMKYVSASADVGAGDAVVTSGLDRIFPKGLVVGRVRSVGPVAGLFKEVLVTPSARFEELEEVLVLRGATEAPVLTEAVK